MGQFTLLPGFNSTASDSGTGVLPGNNDFITHAIQLQQNRFNNDKLRYDRHKQEVADLKSEILDGKFDTGGVREIDQDNIYALINKLNQQDSDPKYAGALKPNGTPEEMKMYNERQALITATKNAINTSKVAKTWEANKKIFMNEPDNIAFSTDENKQIVNGVSSKPIVGADGKALYDLPELKQDLGYSPLRDQPRVQKGITNYEHDITLTTTENGIITSTKIKVPSMQNFIPAIDNMFLYDHTIEGDNRRTYVRKLRDIANDPSKIKLDTNGKEYIIDPSSGSKIYLEIPKFDENSTINDKTGDLIPSGTVSIKDADDQTIYRFLQVPLQWKYLLTEQSKSMTGRAAGLSPEQKKWQTSAGGLAQQYGNIQNIVDQVYSMMYDNKQKTASFQNISVGGMDYDAQEVKQIPNALSKISLPTGLNGLTNQLDKVYVYNDPLDPNNSRIILKYKFETKYKADGTLDPDSKYEVKSLDNIMLTAIPANGGNFQDFSAFIKNTNALQGDNSALFKADIYASTFNSLPFEWSGSSGAGTYTRKQGKQGAQQPGQPITMKLADIKNGYDFGTMTDDEIIDFYKAQNITVTK